MPLSALAGSHAPCFVIGFVIGIALAPQDDGSRMQWWREARVGIVVRLGLDPGAADDATLAQRFDPNRFDARALAAAAKGAGMKSLAITAKHDDGFALFDSKLSEFDVAATPFQRDVVREMAAACAEAGLVFGLRFPIEDRQRPDDAAFTMGQLTELLSNYGPVGVIGLEGGKEPSADERHAEAVALIRRLQPEILVSTEGSLAMQGDDGVRPTAILLRGLVDAVSEGGHGLLEVGLDAHGEIPPECAERLADLGRWFAANDESLHGTTASPFRRLAFGRCTMNMGKAAKLPAPAGKSTLYLHVFDWPKDGVLRLPGLRNRTVGARLLADPERGGVLATRDGDDVLVLLPGDRIDPIDSVVALTISGPPDVELPIARPDAQGVVKLAAVDAELHGRQVRFAGDTSDPLLDVASCITSWSDASDFVTWEFELPAPARLEVAVEYACPPDSAGSEVIVSIGAPERPGPELRLAIGSSGAWSRFKSVKAGTLPLLAAGRWTLTVKPASMAHDAVANLRSVSLAPVR